MAENLEGVIHHLRHGGTLPEDLARELFPTDAVHKFREYLHIEDLDWLIPLVLRSHGWTYAFLAPQLTSFRDMPGLRELFRAFWLHEWERRSEFIERDSVLWRLADFDDLGLREKFALYQFVREYWREFLELETQYLGALSGGNILEGVRKRLADKRYPESKAWLYLCVAFGSNEHELVKDLLKQHIANRDGFVREVAAELLREFSDLMESAPKPR